MKIWKILSILSTITASLILFGCPTPFGYYTAGNKVVQSVVNADSSSATAVADITFHSAPNSGETSVLVSEEVSEDRDQLVSLQTDTDGAVIYYCMTAGCTPNPYNSNTHLYNAKKPISVAGNSTTVNISAVALKALMLPSAVANLSMTINYNQTSSPAFDQAGGAFNSPISVTITDSTDDATIWYTTDGKTPTVGGSSDTMSGTSPITVQVSNTATITAVASSAERTDSLPVAATYTIEAYAPTFKQVDGTQAPPGTYLSFQLEIDDATPNAWIWYTNDGTTPIPDSSPGGPAPLPISISKGQTITAVATASGLTNSPVTSSKYTIEVPKITYQGVDGSFVVPLNATNVTVKLWGGGGGGAFGSPNLGVSGIGGSGGGGGYEEQTFAGNGGDTYVVWSGAGGLASGAGNVAAGGGGMTTAALQLSSSSYSIVAIAGGGGGGGGGWGGAGANGGGGSSGGQGIAGSDGGPQGANGVGGDGSNLNNSCGLGCNGQNQSLNVSGKPTANGGPGNTSFVNASGGSGGSGWGGGAGGTFEFGTVTDPNTGILSVIWISGGGGGGGGNYPAPGTPGNTSTQTGSQVLPGNSTDSDYPSGCGVGGSQAETGTAGCAVVTFS